MSTGSTSRRRWKTALLGAAAALLAASLPAWSTHEADHRYTIWGQARDTSGNPLASTKVKVTGLAGRPLGETMTDPSGSYRITLHVHNDQLGQRFWVTIGEVTRSGTITFDPANRVREREHRMDVPDPDAS